MPADGCGLNFFSCDNGSMDPGTYPIRRLVENPGNVLDRGRYPA